jgi:hypothetical protein
MKAGRCFVPISNCVRDGIDVLALVLWNPGYRDRGFRSNVIADPDGR